MTDFESRLLVRGAHGYEEARLGAVWNERKPDRRPDAILVAAGDRDVQEGVRWGVARGLRVSVRSGGHSWIGNGVRDGGLLIDLSALDEVVVDAPNRRATVRPAVQGTRFNALLAAEGLVFPSGHCPSVGVGGFLLGGGYGWNSRALGPACFSVEGVDAVLADGTLVHATDETHPDLMWAVRGAGPGFFAVVTRFHLRVHPAYDQILRSAYVFPHELRDEVLAWSYDTVPEVSDSLELSAKVACTPGVERPTTTITAAAFCTPQDGPEMLEPLERAPFLRHALRRIERRPSSLDDLYALSDGLTPKGRRYAVDGVWTDAPVERVLDAGQEVLDGIPTRESFLLWMLWGGQPTRENACWSTQGRLYFSPNAVWRDPADDLLGETWAHDSLRALDPVAHGTQFADANPADRPDHGLRAEQAARLERLRERYDPHGLFRTYLSPEESTTALAVRRRAERTA
ncbi:FAD-binding oxidoreductase [Streptomyces sp. AC512_CC834]|uniref:FAD-binding oxidoreductase n=1 Tax=Streptomyces sp. AC512_CC834 TaxID=2823691 RepID=UPI001C26D91E|nr:FAD-binding oxidoreductase [Streptomyces sp. AC512_CC834]